MDIDPGLDPTVSIVDDVAGTVPDKFLCNRRRDARCNLVEVFEQAKPAFATAIV
jgi:hypothetical protein